MTLTAVIALSLVFPSDLRYFMANSRNDDLLQSAINEEIRIYPYNPSWPDQFLREKTRLLNIFERDLLDIQHIGSTAVPGLDAKPIIDMMAAVKSMDVADKLLVPLRDFGYVTPPECNANLQERRWLMRHANGHRTHHLHMVKLGSEGWNRTIKFREILRSNPASAQAYKELKLKLAESAGSGRDKYIQGKTEFIDKLLKRF